LTWRTSVVSIIFSNCHYCGSAPSNTKRHKNSIQPIAYSGIDRKDNAIGYVSGNVVPCCRVCNRAKETLSVSAFAAWAKSLAAMADQWGIA
jgi:hypothetical protein